MRFFLFIFFCIPLLAFSSGDKRLALVIGNSNYENAPLNNPVNDALLMAKTLDSLNFDVILDTNISNRGGFIKTIREFGDKRPEYDVAFVYYAGHGIQVGAENFLLPTKEVFESENDVLDYGVSVQNIMRYLTAISNQVNILVLDACRNNPYENNWKKTRSLKGAGLAKIPPPTGSLIAFSTDAGNTAEDGDGDNSIYCESLCKNMMLDNTSLDQVFRNVRSNVLKLTDGNQRPVESSQLTGSVYYLNTISINELSLTINQMIVEGKLDSALDLVNFLIYKYPENYIGYVKKGHIDLLNVDTYGAINNYNTAIKLNPNCKEAYSFSFVSKDELDNLGIINAKGYLNLESINDINQLIKIDNKNPVAYWHLAHYYYKIDNEKALDVLFSIVDTSSFSNYKDYFQTHNYIINNGSYSLLADIFTLISYTYEDLDNLDSSLIYAKKALFYEKSYLKAYIYEQLGEICYKLGKFEDAKLHFSSSLNLMTTSPNILISLAKCFVKLNDFENADNIYSQAIANAIESRFLEFPYYVERSIFYFDQKRYLESLLDVSNAILQSSEAEDLFGKENLPENAKKNELYKFRAKIYNNLFDEVLMCSDLKNACDLGDCEMFNKNCK